MAVRIVSGDEGMAEAARRLRSGLLVAFPTETVYGLGADALNPDAVAAIFAAKGRPADNPVIVHVADVAAAKALARAWPPAAEALAARFWPGALTLVVERTDAIPAVVSAGGPTVGLRVPSHPVAVALLRRSGVPIAAPSANRSEEISPTTAAHVAASLSEGVDDLLVVDGGPCDIGLESTVVDVTCDPPRVLRPGMVTLEMLRDVVPEIVEGATEGTVARSPGQRPRHYAPKAPLVLVPPHEAFAFAFRPGDALLWHSVWPGQAIARTTDPAKMLQVCMPHRAQDYAAALYDVLRRVDQPGVERILVETPPTGDAWEAIHDRLRRASVRESLSP